MSSLRPQETVSTCLYGDQDHRDRVLFEYHAFSLIVAISLSFLLMGSDKLLRVYRPLYFVVNFSLFFQIFSDLLFFTYFPYNANEGNCFEFVVGRLYVLLIMFGELHQVYFIANVLGLSRIRFRILFSNSSISLQSFLQISTFFIALSLVCSIFLRGMFMIDQDIWSLFVVGMQLYFISYAKKGAVPSDAVVDVHNDAVSIFATLSWLQIIPTVIALTDRLLDLNGYHFYRSLDGVMLILECLNEYLFYIKILVLQEKASTVNVEVYEAA